MVLSLVLKQVVNNLMFFGCSIVSFNFKILFFNCIFFIIHLAVCHQQLHVS